MSEQWRPVAGWPYEVSDAGRVRRAATGHVCRPQTWPRTGRLYVTLMSKPRQKNVAVHLLVCEAWHGPCPAGQVARHLDGVHTNNVPDNLRWGTQSENLLDAVGHGTHNNARKTHCPYGHPYDAANTKVWRGGRYCKECGRRRDREYAAQKAARQ